MLAQIRAFAKSPVAQVLLALLVVSFAIWGIKDVFRNAAVSNAVVQAPGRRAIEGPEFRRIFERYRSQAEQESGQPLTTQDAVKQGLDRRLADSLAGTEAVAALLAKDGVRPSDQVVVDQLRAIPRLFNPVTGKFSQDAYARLLSQIGMTKTAFEQALRDQAAEEHLGAGAAAALRPPKIFGALGAAFANEQRTFTAFPVSPKILPPPGQPTDAELNQFIKENAAQLTKPEMRALTVVHISAAELAAQQKADPAAVEKRFNFEKDSLSVPEKRSVVEVTGLKDGKTAQAAADQLRAGKSPDAVAKAFGGQSFSVVDQPKTALPDPKAADAIFAMKEGEVAPVEGQLSWAAARVLKITPGHAATLDEVRPRIEAEVKKSAAEDAAYQQVQKLEDARSAGASLVDAARKAGLTPVSKAPITAQGGDLRGQSAGVPPKVLQSAFATSQGSDTDVIDLGQGEYWAVHVDKVLPPALIALDEARPEITQQYVLNGLIKKLKARADQLADAVRKGQSMQQAAAQIGAPVQANVTVRRAAPPQGLSRDLLARLFTAKPGEVVIAQDPQGLIVAKLDAVSLPPVDQVAPQVPIQQYQMAQGIAKELQAQTTAAAVALMKPKVDYAKARTAVGGDAAP